MHLHPIPIFAVFQKMFCVFFERSFDHSAPIARGTLMIENERNKRRATIRPTVGLSIALKVPFNAPNRAKIDHLASIAKDQVNVLQWFTPSMRPLQKQHWEAVKL
jgi:hypothetical protein